MRIHKKKRGEKTRSFNRQTDTTRVVRARRLRNHYPDGGGGDYRAPFPPSIRRRTADVFLFGYFAEGNLAFVGSRFVCFTGRTIRSLPTSSGHIVRICVEQLLRRDWGDSRRLER